MSIATRHVENVVVVTCRVYVCDMCSKEGGAPDEDLMIPLGWVGLIESMAEWSQAERRDFCSYACLRDFVRGRA